MPKFPPIPASLKKGGHGTVRDFLPRPEANFRVIGPHTHLLKPAEIMGIDAEQELQNSACNSKTFGVNARKLRS